MFILATDEQIWRCLILNNTWEKFAEFGGIHGRHRGHYYYIRNNDGALVEENKILLTNDERYLIMNTCCLDLNEMRRIEVNRVSKYRHMIMMGSNANSKWSELIVYGLTRDVWNKYENESVMMFPSTDVLRLIQAFSGSENIHYLNEEKHWKMNVFDLIPDYQL